MPKHLSEHMEENMEFNYDSVLPGYDYHSNLVMTINHCEATCENMITMVNGFHDCDDRVKQVRLLRDCADICTLTAKFIARNSIFARQIANLCAYICQMCGKECLRFKDSESQNCGRVCLNCARECQIFAMSSPQMY